MNRRFHILGLVALIAASAGCSARYPAPSSAPIGAPGSSEAAPSAGPTGPVAHEVTAPPSVATPTPEPPVDGGTRFHLDCEEQPCQVSLLDADAVPMPGWPVQLEGFCLGGTADASGRVFVACEGDDVGPMIYGFDSAGAVIDGWPLRLTAPIGTNSVNDFSAICGRHLSPIAVASDGIVYVSTWDESQRLLHAFDPNGQEQAGWPRPLPGDNLLGCGGFAVLADGTLRAWGYEGPPPVELELGYTAFAQRTVFTALAADGATLPGWPFGSTGTGSGALIASDGTLYHVSEAGNVWAHGTDGQPKPGWPYEAGQAHLSPYLAPDGRLVLLSAWGSGEIIAVDAGGALVPGWPRRLLVSRASACAFTGDTDCFSQIEPAFGPDGTLYLGIAPIADGRGGSILSFGPDGAMSPGWPFQLPDRTHVAGLAVDTAGNLVVRTVTCAEPCWETVDFGSIVISPAGTTGG